MVYSDNAFALYTGAWKNWKSTSNRTFRNHTGNGTIHVFFFTFIQISLQERKEAEPQHLITLQTFIFNPSCLHSLFQRSVLPPIYHCTCYISDAPCKSLMRFDTGVSFAILIWPLCLQHTHSHIHTHTKRKEAKVKQNVYSRCPPFHCSGLHHQLFKECSAFPFLLLFFPVWEKLHWMYEVLEPHEWKKKRKKESGNVLKMCIILRSKVVIDENRSMLQEEGFFFGGGVYFK